MCLSLAPELFSPSVLLSGGCFSSGPLLPLVLQRLVSHFSQRNAEVLVMAFPGPAGCGLSSACGPPFLSLSLSRIILCPPPLHPQNVENVPASGLELRSSSAWKDTMADCLSSSTFLHSRHLVVAVSRHLLKLQLFRLRGEPHETMCVLLTFKFYLSHFL